MIDWSAVVGEFFGTFVLIVLGNGVVAGALLSQSKARNAGWISITAGWAVGVFAGVAVSAALGDADGHLNPAFTIASVMMTGHAERLFTYIPAQILGALCGAAVVWLHYKPHWQLTEDPDAKFACFATAPAVYAPGWNLLSEIIGTFVLVLVATALFSKRIAPAGVAPGLGPLLVGALVWGIGLSLGGTTGYAINPARDLGPRLAHALLPIAGKGSSAWGYAWIPVLGPVIGAILAVAVIRTFNVA
ncbi:MIP/aquaporin family protein [Edaphobacter modestus]|uniref:Glycerol uptake facilitator protein n=1 Tax=Edaphobacter modestus TaxID=388466 RepID=A0A4Q7YVN7_9BACT|nr:MIP/aquaporin family protein [Edaphobacter modestus]RZU41952.1 glycerol uptake facilitator protein [Edaphobacter modestus]